MPVCSYLVIPEQGATAQLVRKIRTLPGCDVARSNEGRVILLVTDTPDPESDRELRASLEALDGIHALVLTFGEIDPETEKADPLAVGRRRKRGSRSLPVVDPGGLSIPTASPPVLDPSAHGGDER